MEGVSAEGSKKIGAKLSFRSGLFCLLVSAADDQAQDQTNEGGDDPA